MIILEQLQIELKSALLDFDTDRVKQLLNIQLVENQMLIPNLIEKVLSEIGTEWENGELALSQVYMSGKICEDVIGELFRDIQSTKISEYKIAIVTFYDFHTLGKKIISSALKSVGFNIVDLGQGIGLYPLIEKIEELQIEILLISVLMLPSALKIRDLRTELDKRNLKVKVLVGGAPFNFDKKLWKTVGADAMGYSPTDAIAVLNEWLK